jgi:NAD(P)-dependent dehydrogenase (short-subunit alcohol dehydrogenase family)
MADRLHQSVEEQRSAAMHPMKRLGLPEEQAAAVIYLCSEGAGFVTGTCVVVDGGATARSGIG